MRKSEIFESFAKLLEEKEISKDAPEKAIKILENNPRMDSLTAKEIEKLYNLKPDSPKNMQYVKNIAEVAHKEPVVVSPAYDKLNGLVENINERQNILLHIVNKTPDGLAMQRKYAEQDLVLALVRVGNDLDNRNQDQLRSLADACLFQVSNKSLRKNAIAPLLVAVPALLGALYLQQHLSFVNEGFTQNNKKLMDELDDLLQSNDNFGVGYKYKPTFINFVQNFKNKLNSFNSLYLKVEPIIRDLEQPKDAKTLLQISKEPKSDEVIQAYNALKSSIYNLVPEIEAVQRNFSSANYKNRQIEEKGFFSSLVDKTQILHGGQGLVADDFDDVARAIPPYLKSIQDLAQLLAGAGSIQQKAQNDLEEAAYKSEDLFGNVSDTQTKNITDNNVQDLDQEAADLEKELSEGLPA